MIPYRYRQLLRGLRRKDRLKVSGAAIVAVYALTIALACLQLKAISVANAASGAPKDYGAANAILPRLYLPHSYLCSDGDNTAGLQDALNSPGDVRIFGNNCDFNGTVFIPSNKQLQCASRAVVLHFTSRDNKTPFLKVDNAHDISISNCTFTDDPQMPPMIFADGSPTSFNFDVIGGGYTGRSYNVRVTGNVFLHPRGQAAVEVYDSTGTNVQPFDWDISYNDFKWCGYYSANFDNVAASHIDHNYAFDCAIGNEGERRTIIYGNYTRLQLCHAR
jgi:hypothetical protein